MAGIKLVLLNPKRPNADGCCPLAIRITVNRKQLYTGIGHNVKPSDWDDAAQRVRKSHPNSARLNALILKKLSEANETLLDMQGQRPDVSAKAVKQSLQPKRSATFFAQADGYIDQLRKRGKYSQYKAELSRLKTFRAFLKGADPAFGDVNPGLLLRYDAWLDEPRERKLSERTKVNHLMTVRAVFSHAMKEHPQLEKHYPFGKKGVSIKFPTSLKIGLSKEEVKRIETLPLVSLSPADHARNIWLMSFYFAGVRNGDILALRWTDFHDGRLHYTMGKNHKPGSIKLNDKALEILALYEPLRDETNLVFLKLRNVKDWKDAFAVGQRIATVNRSLNRTLKVIASKAGINKNLSMHISRHTFGNIAGGNVPVQVLQQVYRHSNIQTTIGYQASFIHGANDDAIDTVTSF